ncbi:hypothetical protein MIB92_00260 [Aestuariirhabdus sp. Z084]|uniref:hypothetical protein n=1 Tax=Aestuariirhabdus haliotis TaxID=2918751 RepID=UPI00201B395F|nr:hypothetical protein [Aestuariirhabdus haliotis]MCL6414068.1 hypothetical protein [Aestuariirhabdus haliotis]MCL6418001.1 hypothetical protein [Aestuariirhabdus haliotis]
MSEIQTINVNKVEVKLADTDDPLAQKISWNPAKSGGSNFKTQKMTVEGKRVVIERSIGAILFSLIFAIPGTLAVVLGVPFFLFDGEYFGAVFLLVWGVMFGGAGYYLLLSGKKFTIDKDQGVYYRGKAYDKMKALPEDVQGRTREIHALQLISERVRSRSKNGGTSTYFSYEMNLVLRNGERINIMDHGKGNEVEKSAIEIAELLRIPVWKAEY